MVDPRTGGGYTGRISEPAPPAAERNARQPWTDPWEAVVLHHEAARQRVRGHWNLLGRYIAEPPSAIVLDETCSGCGGNHGRPRLPRGHPVRFSSSSSGGRALLAFARDAEVGVDVERLDRTVNLAEAARLVLTPGGLSALNALPAAERLSYFLRSWRREEALARASGLGLELAIHKIETAPGGRLLAVPPAAGMPGDWLLRDVPTEDGFAAALAARPRSQEFG